MLATKEQTLEEHEEQISTSEDEIRHKPSKQTSFSLLLDDDDEDEDDVEEGSDITDATADEEDVEADELLRDEPEVDSDEEFEEALKGLDSAILESSHRANESPSSSSWPLFSLLQVSTEQLDPLAELKRKLGNFNAAAGAADQRFAGLIERVKDAKAKRVTGRKGRAQLVPTQPSWPAVPMPLIGLELKRDEGAGDGSFILEHTEPYLRGLTTAVYLMRQGDIDGLVSLIHAGNPYQIDALLIISDYVRMSSISEAAELVEWCIHLMERCFVGSGFNPFTDTEARGHLLPYDVPENRKMHLALFRHLQYLLRRGCNRTAMEFGKLMLCLDVEDPLLVTPILALAALQAKEYEWLIGFGAELALWKPHQFDWKMATAMAHYLKGDGESADRLMKTIVTTHPFITKHIVWALGGEYEDANPELNAPEKALSKIFMLRFQSFMKGDRQLSVWLRSISKVESDDQEDEDGWEDPVEAARIYRHALLSDIQNLNVALPKDIAAREIHLYDPIPPEHLGAPPSIVSGLAENLSRVLARFFS